jgi:hypothetical protein
MTEHLKAGNPPTEENKVVISFLGDEFLAGNVIDLGLHLLDKTKINNENVDCEKYEDITKYNFVEKGFQTIVFDEEMMSKLNPLYEISRNLSPNVNTNMDDDPQIQEYINILQEWIKKKYTELTGETEITAVCSRHLILRIAGCDKTSCQIPGNPLFHLDYISFEATYDRQCREQEQFTYKSECPDLEDMIDVVNIWFPTDEVKDWPLGFLDIDSVEIKDYVPIQLVVGSQASSIRYKPNLNVIYKDKLKPPEVYLFRSATKDSSKKGVVHGSFRITDENFQRRSVEIRCCIFKNKKSKKNKAKKRTQRRRRRISKNTSISAKSKK